MSLWFVQNSRCCMYYAVLHCMIKTNISRCAIYICIILLCVITWLFPSNIFTICITIKWMECSIKYHVVMSLVVTTPNCMNKLFYTYYIMGIGKPSSAEIRMTIGRNNMMIQKNEIHCCVLSVKGVSSHDRYPAIWYRLFTGISCTWYWIILTKMLIAVYILETVFLDTYCFCHTSKKHRWYLKFLAK